ncbi:TPA: hypothetical protein HA251_04985 [Candidatus Woesearchaeota archaeon]|nr:hypothetical protein [Candidatus Woesearchaeota archaeon]
MNIQHRAMTIHNNNLESFAQSSIRDNVVFELSYDHASQTYETQWERDQYRTQEDIIEAATRFLWCFNDKIAVTGTDGRTRTTRTEDVWPSLLAQGDDSCDGYLQLSTPIATLSIGSTMLTCRTKDRIVLPLADLIGWTGYGHWNEEYNHLGVDKLDAEMQRPADLQGALRTAYRCVR